MIKRRLLLMYDIAIPAGGRCSMEKKPLNVAVGERIRFMREKGRLTREQLAERANISIQFLSDIENGMKSMTVPTIINLADALHVSTDYLLLGRTEECPSSVDASLIAMLAALPEKQRQVAGELLRCFVEGVTS